MTPIYIIVLLLYLLSNYLFDKLRYVLNFMTITLGIIFFINDWNNTVVSDDLVKLSFMLSFALYGLMIFVNIYTDEEK